MNNSMSHLILCMESCASFQSGGKEYFLYDGFAHLAAGLACGLAGLAAGMAIGIVGDAGVR
jgi:V-type H+-transporting ATPase proteolipid subunit